MGLAGVFVAAANSDSQREVGPLLSSSAWFLEACIAKQRTHVGIEMATDGVGSDEVFVHFVWHVEVRVDTAVLELDLELSLCLGISDGSDA